LIVVQGSLGDLEGLNFLIDTGVNPTEVDTGIARKFSPTGGLRKLALVNQDAAVTQVVIRNLQIGPIKVRSVPAVVQDLSTLKKALGIRIDVIVGFGVLSLSSFSIDYRKKTLVFGPIESQSAVPFDTGPPVITVVFFDEPVLLLRLNREDPDSESVDPQPIVPKYSAGL
jgi:hypothetical protein